MTKPGYYSPEVRPSLGVFVAPKLAIFHRKLDHLQPFFWQPKPDFFHRNSDHIQASFGTQNQLCFKRSWKLDKLQAFSQWVCIFLATENRCTMFIHFICDQTKTVYVPRKVRPSPGSILVTKPGYYSPDAGTSGCFCGTPNRLFLTGSGPSPAILLVTKSLPTLTLHDELLLKKTVMILRQVLK